MVVVQSRLNPDSQQEALQQVPWLQRGFFWGVFCFAPYLQAGPGAGDNSAGGTRMGWTTSLGATRAVL